MWKFETSCVDGQGILFGVKIFDYEWVYVENVIIHDYPRLTQQNNNLSVYSVIIHDTKYQFAAREMSNCVWAFYIRS